LIPEIKKKPDQWDYFGKEKRARAIQRLRERKKRVLGKKVWIPLLALCFY